MNYKKYIGISIAFSLLVWFLIAALTYQSSIYTIDPDELDQGVTGNGRTLYAICNKIGTTKPATIRVVNRGRNNYDKYIFLTTFNGANYTNIMVEFQNGAQLTGAGTLTLPSPEHVVAGKKQQIVESGQTTLAFATGGTVYAEWWNSACSDGSTNATTAIQSAINSLPSVASEIEYGKSGTLQLQEGTYLCTTGIDNNDRKINISGVSRYATVLKKNDNINLLLIPGSFTGCTIENMTFDGNSKTGACLAFAADTAGGNGSSNYYNLRNLSFRNNGATAPGTDADAALYIDVSSVCYARGLDFTSNEYAMFINDHNGGVFENIVVGGLVTSVYSNIYIKGGSNITMTGLLLQDYGGMRVGNHKGFHLTGVTIELNGVGYPGITLENATRGAIIDTVYALHAGTGNQTTTSAFAIQVNGSQIEDNVIIRNYNYTARTEDDTISSTYGHIYLSAVTGAILENIGGSLKTENSTVVVQNTGLNHTFTNFNFTMADATAVPLVIKADNTTLDGFKALQTATERASVTIYDEAINVKVRNTLAAITVNNVATVTGTILENCGGTITDAGNRAMKINGASIRYPYIQVNSAAELTLSDGNFFNIMGTTGITSIAAASSTVGRYVCLHFNGTLTVSDGNNLYLSGNFSATDADMLCLFCDGTNWYQTPGNN